MHNFLQKKAKGGQIGTANDTYVTWVIHRQQKENECDQKSGQQGEDRQHDKKYGFPNCSVHK